MNVLVVGSGGREHALAWKLAQSPRVEKVFCAPGNGGTRLVGENVPIADSDVAALAAFAADQTIGLTVVGPELPLSLGIVDEFERKGLKIFGPTRKAAELEGSKIFAKQFMARHKIPTARFHIAPNFEEARAVIKSGELGFPVVLKADGLAAGKGVVVCPNARRAEETAHEMMVGKKMGDAGRRLVVEEFLRGREVSFIVVSDGRRVQPLVTTMDHKAVYDGDKGPNTGGMGAISPSPHMTDALYADVMNTVIFPTVLRMLEENRKLKGVLYAGLMLTEDGPKVLEFNTRFGDPETQPQMLRLESDLADLLLSAVEEDILREDVRWSRRPAGCVVAASGGYPVQYETGRPITGLDEVKDIPGLVVFHAGTRYENGAYLTAGGRVLGVSATGESLPDAMGKIYEALEKIRFEAMHYRRDIGAVREESE